MKTSKKVFAAVAKISLYFAALLVAAGASYFYGFNHGAEDWQRVTLCDARTVAEWRSHDQPIRQILRHAIEVPLVVDE